MGESDMELNNNDIKKAQQRLLYAAVQIRDILESKNIKYMITFGTLLGAVRHKGFIPWDDDFDFFLFDEEYETAVEALRKDLPQDLFLEDPVSEPLYFHSWAHVKDTQTVASCSQFPQDSIYRHKGLSVDLYRAIKMDDRDVDLFRLKQNLLYRERTFRAGWNTEQEFQTYKNSLDKQIKEEELRIKSLPLRGDVLAMVLNERAMRIEDVFPLRRYDFENESFFGPGDYDAVLQSFYGDYMKLPPEEDRHPHYDSVEFL